MPDKADDDNRQPLENRLDDEFQKLADGKRIQYEDVRLYYKSNNGIFFATSEQAIGFLELSSGIGVGMYDIIEEDEAKYVEEARFMKFNVDDKTAAEFKSLISIANAKTSSVGDASDSKSDNPMYM